MNATFQLSGLPVEPFAPLFGADTAILARHGARRMIADSDHGYPCRVSLRDARAGEVVLLLPYTHQPADSPYRAAGPIFVREDACPSRPDPGQLPAYITSRVHVSLRAYDVDHMLCAAGVCSGAETAAAIERTWNDPRAAYLHLHNAAWGCYLGRVDRA